jgi:Putative peptidase family
MAHEIGHLLGNQHSTSGIMRGDWTLRALMDISRGYLLFNPKEGRRMQVNAAARVRPWRAAK